MSDETTDWTESNAEPAAEPRPRSRRAISGMVALLLVGGVGGALIGHSIGRPAPSSGATTPTTGGSQLTPGGGMNTFFQGPFGAGGTSANSATATNSGPSNAATIAKTVNPAVVDINTTLGYQSAKAAGTGMVLTSTGEILTNNHVIDGATAISVTDIGNGTTYKATVVGYDKARDIAVLQLQNASGLATITTSSTAATSGTGVVGIGNAGGTGGTPSYAGGTVTAVDQHITASDEGDGTSEKLTGLLETDAAIVSGDSGGPLVNASGQVVGMDTAASEASGFQSQQASTAYAIPIATAMAVAAQIEAGQASSTIHIGTTAMLGVSVESAAAAGGSGSGAVVAQVVSGGPAAKAGIRGGDTIVGLNGQPVTSPRRLSANVLQLVPGTTATVRYLDGNGAAHTAHVGLVTGPPQ